MYAGKIMLIGTEAGLGVRNAGTIGAGSRARLVVTAAGRLENIGTLEAQQHRSSTSAGQYRQPRRHDPPDQQRGGLGIYCADA